MCGVFGLISKESENNLSFRKLAEIGLESIRRRGPDNNTLAFHRSGDFTMALAHTRLSILGLSADANQPMYSKCGRYALSYNGEIYNFIELRAELEALGVLFSTDSDTEVLLQCWMRWGGDCLQKLNGMFAFCIADLRASKVTLVRDRFGVKPLYYSIRKDFVFGSSAAGIAKIIGAKPNLNFVARGLKYSVYEDGSDETQFENVKVLTAGHQLVVDFSDGSMKKNMLRWYSLSDAVDRRRDEQASKPLEELADEALSILSNAVKVRLRADVPMAMSLSSGLDSTAVASIARNEGANLLGFCFGTSNDEKSEGVGVTQFSRERGVECEFVWPTLDKSFFANLLDRTLLHQEAPFSSTSVMAQNEVFYFASKSGFNVLLGGQGGDETFGGYRKFLLFCLKDALQKRDPKAALTFFFSVLHMLFADRSQITTYLRNLKRYRSTSASGFLVLDLPDTSLNLWGDKNIELSERQILDVLSFSLPSLLRYEDKNSMGNGVESRLPFMDVNLIEFAISLPVNRKIRQGYGKWMLRHITKGLVPNNIRLSRIKRGFDVSQNWIENGLAEALLDRLAGQANTFDFLLNHKKFGVQFTQKNLLSNNQMLAESLALAWLADPDRI